MMVLLTVSMTESIDDRNMSLFCLFVCLSVCFLFLSLAVVLHFLLFLWMYINVLIWPHANKQKVLRLDVDK